MVASPPFSTGYALWACFPGQGEDPGPRRARLAAAELLLIVGSRFTTCCPGTGADVECREIVDRFPEKEAWVASQGLDAEVAKYVCEQIGVPWQA